MWHPAGGGMPLARLYPFLEIAAMRKGLCLLHGGGTDTAALARLFPGLTFLVNAGAEGAMELCAPLDNAWFEIVQRPSDPTSMWDFGKLVDQLGSERIVFGSDAPYYDWRILQRALESAAVSETIKDRIAYQNALSLIRAFVPGWSPPTAPPIPPRLDPNGELWTARGERLL